MLSVTYTITFGRQTRCFSSSPRAATNPMSWIDKGQDKHAWMQIEWIRRSWGPGSEIGGNLYSVRIKPQRSDDWSRDFLERLLKL